MSEPVENRPVETGGQGPVELDRATVGNAMWRHLITLQWSWNYERMQALGYCYSMLPVINKVYRSRDERIAAIKRHLVFYNTNPQVGSPPIFGATVALEAQKQGQVVDSLKVALMGPLAGIGDTIQAILYRPIIAVFAASMALAGSMGGPLLMFLSGLLWTALMIPLFWLGYREGVGLASQVAEGGLVTRITDLATMMGMVVIGGFVPSIMAKVQTPLEFARRVTVQGKVTEQVVKIQSVLDQIVPYLIPVLLVAFAYWLLRGLKLSPVWVMVVLFVVGFGLSAIGVL
ncbi:MAG: PTS system mannose/fructose/sorbose family transporter subunit IID [Bacillota bacterium]|nr:PTS system mannose/fructose/sorbose family transporter subunit IID [Bacillota bacterium]